MTTESRTFENGTLFRYSEHVIYEAVFIGSESDLVGDWKGTGSKLVGSNLSRLHIVFHANVHKPDIGRLNFVVFQSKMDNWSIAIIG